MPGLINDIAGLQNMLGSWDIFQNQQSMGPLAMLGIGAAQTGIQGLFNAHTAKKDREHQLKLWRMNNEYNHPSAQMARLRQAGLNPNLMYGQGTVGNSASPAKSTPTRGVDFDALGAILAGQNIKQMEAQTDNLRAQNTLLTQEKLLKIIETAIGRENLKEKRERNKILPDALAAELGIKQSQNSIKNIEANLSNSEWAFLNNNYDLFEKFMRSKYMKQVLQNEGQEALNAIRNLEKEIKTTLRDFTETNQWVALLSKLATIIKAF